MMRLLRKTPAAAAVILGASFVGHSLVSLARHHLTVLHKDQWRIYYDYFSMPFLDAILKDQNGHFKILPALLYFTDIHFFSATNTFLVLLGNVLAAVTAALFTSFVVRDQQLSGSARAILSTFVWVALFWLASFVALGWGNVGVNIYLVSALLAASLAVLIRSDTVVRAGRPAAAWWHLAAASSLALVATFSFGAGIVVFPTLVFCALAVKLPARMTVALATATVANAGLFLTVFPRRRALGKLTIEPLPMLEGLGQWLGSPWFQMINGTWLNQYREVVARSVTPVLGLLLLGAAALVGLRCLRRQSAVGRIEVFLTSIVIFGVFVAPLGVVLRSDLAKGDQYFFLGPRYMAWSLLAWIAMICLMVVLAQKLKRSRALIQGALLTAMGLAPVLLWQSHTAYLKNYIVVGQHDQEAALGLLVGVQDRDLVKRRLFRDPSKVFRVAEELRERDLNVFSRGWHHWISQPVDELFTQTDQGVCEGGVNRVQPFEDRGTTSARVIGWARLERPTAPQTVLIVGPQRQITGLAGFTRRRFRRGAAAPRIGQEMRGFFGYITPFQDQIDYRILFLLADGRRFCDPGLTF